MGGRLDPLDDSVPAPPSADTPAIAELGHRVFVGRKWNQMGRLQFDFMRRNGLQPEHVFLDIACGSLRGGVHFIRYLKHGNYLGLDKNAELVRRGVC